MEEKTKYQLRYLIIPDYAYSDNRLTLISLKVYGFIHSYTNPFRFGNEHLAMMFNCSERSITEALMKLEEYGYITLKHTPQSTGGTTRLAVDCYPDSQFTSSRVEKVEAPTRSLLLHKDIKDNNRKRETLNGVSSLSYLKNIPLEDLVEFTTSFNCNQTQVKDKALGLYDYCEAKGRRYKNYKAFLRNALRRDYPKLPDRTTHEGMEDHGYINMSQLPGRQDDI